MDITQIKSILHGNIISLRDELETLSLVHTLFQDPLTNLDMQLSSGRCDVTVTFLAYPYKILAEENTRLIFSLADDEQGLIFLNSLNLIALLSDSLPIVFKSKADLKSISSFSRLDRSMIALSRFPIDGHMISPDDPHYEIYRRLYEMEDIPDEKKRFAIKYIEDYLHGNLRQAYHLYLSPQLPIPKNSFSFSKYDALIWIPAKPSHRIFLNYNGFQPRLTDDYIGNRAILNQEIKTRSHNFFLTLDGSAIHSEPIAMALELYRMLSELSCRIHAA